MVACHEYFSNVHRSYFACFSCPSHNAIKVHQAAGVGGYENFRAAGHYGFNLCPAHIHRQLWHLNAERITAVYYKPKKYVTFLFTLWDLLPQQ